jgi:hypothetical protein
MKPYHEMTEEEQLEYGREVATDPTCHDMDRQGRPLTNVEMHAATLWLLQERRKADHFLKDEL